MFLAVLNSLQVWIAYRIDYDSRPLDHIWSMAVHCPNMSVPYFADHRFSQKKVAMHVSEREAGEMMSPANTRNDRLCCKRITLQNLGVIA
jgi:hypothetical protein